MCVCVIVWSTLRARPSLPLTPYSTVKVSAGEIHRVTYWNSDSEKIHNFGPHSMRWRVRGTVAARRVDGEVYYRRRGHSLPQYAAAMGGRPPWRVPSLEYLLLVYYYKDGLNVLMRCYFTYIILTRRSTSLFPKVKSPIFFRISFLRSLHITCRSQDWYLRYWLRFVVSSHIHFAIIYPYIIHSNFYLIWIFYE